MTALPAHVALEAYSVLSAAGWSGRCPRGGCRVLGERFGDRPLRLATQDREALLGTLAAAGISGGASYDAPGALDAAEHGRTLLTLDERAQRTYQRLGAAFQMIAG